MSEQRRRPQSEELSTLDRVALADDFVSMAQEARRRAAGADGELDRLIFVDLAERFEAQADAHRQ